MYLYFIDACGDNRDVHSFPTRRSSDLTRGWRRDSLRRRAQGIRWAGTGSCADRTRAFAVSPFRVRTKRNSSRSEEHTSELQSHVNLVCRLLLEKKKNKTFMNEHLRLNT